jgi:hypothetical protein
VVHGVVPVPEPGELGLPLGEHALGQVPGPGPQLFPAQRQFGGVVGHHGIQPVVIELVSVLVLYAGAASCRLCCCAVSVAMKDDNIVLWR